LHLTSFKNPKLFLSLLFQKKPIEELVCCGRGVLSEEDNGGVVCCGDGFSGDGVKVFLDIDV